MSRPWFGNGCLGWSRGIGRYDILRHMNLLEMLNGANGGQSVAALAQQFGISEEQVQSVMGQLVPALASGAQNNIAQEGGLEGMLGALMGGNHSQYVDDPSTLAGAGAVEDGNGILGHLLGGKDESRALATQVAGATGLSSTLIKQMLPVVASMAMGAMAKHIGSGAGQGEPATGLAAMLDFNHDGSAMDDVVGLLGKLFR